MVYTYLIYTMILTYAIYGFWMVMHQLVLCVVAASLQPNAEHMLSTNLHVNKGTVV